MLLLRIVSVLLADSPGTVKFKFTYWSGGFPFWLPAYDPHSGFTYL